MSIAGELAVNVFIAPQPAIRVQLLAGGPPGPPGTGGSSSGSGINQYDVPFVALGTAPGSFQSIPTWSDGGPTIEDPWNSQDPNSFAVPFKGIAPLTAVHLATNDFTAFLLGSLLASSTIDLALPLVTLPPWARIGVDTDLEDEDPGPTWEMSDCDAWRLRWGYMDEDETWHIVRTDENVVGVVKADGTIGFLDPESIVPPSNELVDSLIVDFGVAGWFPQTEHPQAAPVGYAQRALVNDYGDFTYSLDPKIGWVLADEGTIEINPDVSYHDGQSWAIITGTSPTTLDPGEAPLHDATGQSLGRHTLAAGGVYQLTYLDGTWTITSDTTHGQDTVTVDQIITVDFGGAVDPLAPGPFAAGLIVAIVGQSDDSNGIWLGQTTNPGDMETWLPAIRVRNLPVHPGDLIVASTAATTYEELGGAPAQGPFLYKLTGEGWTQWVSWLPPVEPWPEIHGLLSTPVVALVGHQNGISRQFYTDDVGPWIGDDGAYSVKYQCVVYDSQPERRAADLPSFMEVLSKFVDDEWLGDQDLNEDAPADRRGLLSIFFEMVRSTDPYPISAGEWAAGRIYTPTSFSIPYGGVITILRTFEGNVDGNTRQRVYYRVHGYTDYDHTTGGWDDNPDETFYWKKVYENVTEGVTVPLDVPTKWRIGLNTGSWAVARIELEKSIAAPELWLHFNAADGQQPDGSVESSAIPGMTWFPYDDDNPPWVIDLRPDRLALAYAQLASVATQLDAKANLVDGKVPESELPSYVDDVIEVVNYAALGDVLALTGKIYVTVDDGKSYRWSGSVFVELAGGVALGETSATAYRGDRGKTAYDHSQSTGNPHGTTAADVGAATTTQGAKADTAVQPQTLTDRKVIPTITFPARASGDAGFSNEAVQWTAQTVGLSAVGMRIWFPFWLPADIGGLAYNRIEVYASTAAASTWRLGLHNVDSDGFPGTNALDGGTVNMSGSTGARTNTISFSNPTPKWYWGVVQVDAYTAQPTVMAGQTDGRGSFMPAGFIAERANSSRTNGALIDALGTSGSFTDPSALTWTANSATGFTVQQAFPRMWIYRVFP